MAEGVAAAAAVAGIKAFGELIAKLGPAVAATVGKSLRAAFDKFDMTFGPHLQVTFDRCTKIKTLLNKDEPVDLLSQYVNLNFVCAKRTYDDYALLEELRKRKRIIISGTAGGGKTIFMKYLWISLFENPQRKVPVFVELRKLNDVTSDDLLLYIYHTIIDTRATVSRTAFDQLVSAGAFVFMFDGFDELLIEKRRSVEKQILAISHNNPGVIVVVSGRPDERFDSWQAFSNFAVQPLNKNQVIELIGKLKYDDKEIKKKFVDRVKKDLYERHKSFLSSPLLPTMMLITFRDFADIPEKIHLFYDQAFDALFSKHDATKEGFKRKLYTDIPSDEFKKLLSYFCLVSYYDQKYEFKIDELKDYINKGISIDSVKLDVDNFIKDLLESICIMQKDGIPIIFSHRTFQEFFSAFCLDRYSIKHLRRILVKFARRPADSVIQMLFDMNQDLVEAEFVLPVLKEIVREIRKLPKKRPLFDYMAMFHPELMVHSDEGSAPRIFIIQGTGDLAVCRSLLRKLYVSDFPWRRTNSKYDEKDKGIVDRLVELGIIKTKKSSIRITVKLQGRAAANKANPQLAWLEETGSGEYYKDEIGVYSKLKAKIEKRRAQRGEKIDDLLGVGRS